MTRKYKYSLEDKIQAAKDFLSGRKGTKQICIELGIRYNSNIELKDYEPNRRVQRIMNLHKPFQKKNV